MAEMPREKSRSLHDRLGGAAEAAQRRERLRRERAEDAAALGRSQRLATLRLPFEQRLAALDLAPRLEPTVTISGQRYREVDNGRANVLIPADDPLVTPAIRAERRRAIERAFFVAEHPIGGTLDGAAVLLGIPQKVRDPLLLGGGAVDTLAGGFAPRGGAQPAWRPSPPRQMPRQELDAGAIRYGGLTSKGQATGMNATVRKEMLGTGTKAARQITTPGLETARGEHRTHLLAKQLGGSGRLPQGLVTASGMPTNKSWMARFENAVARMVRGGEFVDYSVTPIYGPRALPPRLIAMTARGSHGSQIARVVENPAGRPR